MRDRKYVSFSEVCTVKPPKKEAKERLKESDSVSFIPMKDLGVCRKDILGSQSKTLDKVYSGYTYFADNDVLLAKITPCFENGKLGIAKKLVNGIGFGSSEYIVLRANKSLYPKYLFYYLSQESIRVAGRKVMSGAVGHKRVPNDFIETRKIFFPPLPEQKRIVEMLDDAFLAIDKAIENTEKNLKNARDLFDSYLNKVFSDKGEGWKERKLKELCKTFHQGLNTAGEKIKFYESGFPIIQARNINAGLIEYENKIKYMCEDDWIEYKNKYRPQLGDVFFTNIGTIGKTAVVTSDIDYLIHWNIFKIQPLTEHISPFFLKYSLDFFTQTGVFLKAQKGGTVNFVTKKMLSNLIISLPDLSKQESLVEHLDSIRLKVSQLDDVSQQKLTALKCLKQSILQKAFTGELTRDFVSEELAA